MNELAHDTLCCKMDACKIVRMEESGLVEVCEVATKIVATKMVARDLYALRECCCTRCSFNAADIAELPVIRTCIVKEVLILCFPIDLSMVEIWGWDNH